jgi:hypothetical protein
MKLEKTGRNDFITAYTAAWKDGPLCKKDRWSTNYTRDSTKKIA